MEDVWGSLLSPIVDEVYARLHLIGGFLFMDTDNFRLFIESLPTSVKHSLCLRYGSTDTQYDDIVTFLCAHLHPYNMGKIDALEVLGDLLELPEDIRNDINPCLLGAMQRGFLMIHHEEDLQKELHNGSCFNCSHPLSCTIEDALFQKEVGLDYMSGGENAGIVCTHCGIGNYISGLCIATPDFISGRYHFHCRKCPGCFGQCVRNVTQSVHCDSCGNHYQPNNNTFKCRCSLSNMYPETEAPAFLQRLEKRAKRARHDNLFAQEIVSQSIDYDVSNINRNRGRLVPVMIKGLWRHQRSSGNNEQIPMGEEEEADSEEGISDGDDDFPTEEDSEPNIDEIGDKIEAESSD